MTNHRFLSIISFFLGTSLFLSCSESNTCDFNKIEKAVECSCDIATRKKEAGNDPDKLEKIKNEAKQLDAAFEKALEDNHYTKDEFTSLLKENCEDFPGE